MKWETIPYTVAMFLASANVVADNAPTTPHVEPHNMLVAMVVPSGPPSFIGAMASPETCWQSALLLTKSATTQVFFCVPKSAMAPSDSVPPLTAHGRMM